MITLPQTKIDKFITSNYMVKRPQVLVIVSTLTLNNLGQVASSLWISFPIHHVIDFIVLKPSQHLLSCYNLTFQQELKVTIITQSLSTPTGW